MKRGPIQGLSCPNCGGHHITPKGHTRGTPRFTCSNDTRNDPVIKGCGWHGTQPIGLDKWNHGIDTETSATLARKVRVATGVRRYVITAAQNATPVHEDFLESLKGYCKANKAQLLVIPYRYKNPTSTWSQTAQDHDWWDEKLHPYMIRHRVPINRNLLLLADIKTQPTASDPLQGFETISGGMSAIIGHPKVELTSIPTPNQKLPKLLSTTGAVTGLNYIPSKAGKKGEHHHTFGAVVVEVDGPKFFMRQLIAARDGSFCDLNYEYRGSKREQVGVEAIAMGDWHARFTDPSVRKATFEGDDSMVSVLKPKYVIWHDFHDQDSRNHHDLHEPFINAVKAQHGLDRVETELNESFASVDAVYRDGLTFVFPFSNHPNEHLERWLKETDWRKDPINASFYLKTASAVVESAHRTPNGVKYVDPLVYWAQHKLKCFKNCVFLGPDDSFMVADVELGMHGHIGPNGARGTLQAFGKIGVRSVIGHGHGPGIRDGVMMIGTSSYLRVGYNKGPSNWLHAHGLVYKNGKRSLAVIIDGRWRA